MDLTYGSGGNWKSKSMRILCIETCQRNIVGCLREPVSMYIINADSRFWQTTDDIKRHGECVLGPTL